MLRKWTWTNSCYGSRKNRRIITQLHAAVVSLVYAVKQCNWNLMTLQKFNEQQVQTSCDAEISMVKIVAHIVSLPNAILLWRKEEEEELWHDCSLCTRTSFLCFLDKYFVFFAMLDLYENLVLRSTSNCTSTQEVLIPVPVQVPGMDNGQYLYSYL